MSLLSEMSEYRNLPSHEKEVARGWIRKRNKISWAELALDFPLTMAVCATYLLVLYGFGADRFGPKHPVRWYDPVVPIALSQALILWLRTWRLRLQWLRLRKVEIAERQKRVIPGSTGP